MPASRATIEACHDEILGILRAAAPDGDAGERIRADRRSAFDHLGLRTPVRRKLVAAGFSFTTLDEPEVLDIWDGVWRATDWADVMFAVLDHYRERLPVQVSPGFWPVAVEWIDKIDNWAHADDLARVYSWALAADQAQVYPSLVRWNGLDGEWHRRISIVSLVHHSGKHAAFVPPELVLPLIEPCLPDPRPGIQKAVGWVLRELATTWPDETIDFLDRHRADLAGVALRRATERLDPDQRAALRADPG